MTVVHILGGDSVPVTNIACFGRTYAKHAAELGNAVPKQPLLFLKSVRALRPLSEGPIAFSDETFHHEAEVVLLIGCDVAQGSAATWGDVEAVGLGLDLTRRGLQSELKSNGHPWTTSKSFSGSALVSPLTPLASVAERDAIEFTLSVNGDLRQTGTTKNLTHDVPALLSQLSALTPLGRGDLVFTGTPEGVGEIRAGDRFELASPVLGTHAGTL
ncbi:MAG: fumarylacetoacetate hydrolase family protein [Sandaracinaceae bacterium]